MIQRPCNGRLPLSSNLLFGCALFLATTVLHAEEPGGRASTSASTSASSGEEAKQARIEMHAAIARMQSTSHYVRDLLRDARRRGVPRQIACADEALSRADVAHRSARAQEGEALASYARNDLASARAARVRIAELEEAQRLAARDGTACLPQSPNIARSSMKSEPTTLVRLVIDPKIPPER